MFRRVLFSLSCICLTASTALSYWTQTYGFPQGSTIVMQLELGPTNVTLEDGTGTWNGSAANALALWNPHLESVQFSWVSNSIATEQSGDNLNSVFFSNSVFGDDFGDGVLAVTVYLTDQGTNAEADVIVNQAFQYNSYRGPLKPGDPDTTIYDIHRIFLHEFGHVLGLGHPDDHGEYVEALMNSAISDLDHLVDDDIAGAVYLYGIKVYSDIIEAFVGQPFTAQVQTTVPAKSFDATNLPSGVTLDPKTGVISGTISLSGAYRETQATAHGMRTEGSESIWFLIAADDPPENLRGTFPGKVNRVVADGGRNRVYASISDPPGVAVFEGASLTLIKTIAVESEPFGMAISPDGKKLFIAQYREVDPIIGVIDLELLTTLPSLPAPFRSLDVAAGLDNRLFVTQLSQAGIAQIDATTGAVLAPFPYGSFDGTLRLSADRKTLFVGAVNYGPPSLFSVDISTATPLLVQQTSFNQFPGFIGDFKLSQDGSFLCVPGDTAGGVSKLSPTDFTVSLGEYLIPDLGFGGEGPVTGGAVAISPDDSTVFVTAVSGPFESAAIDLFDSSSKAYLRLIEMGNFVPSTFTLDSTGQYLFAPCHDPNYVWQLRVYSTGLPAAPVHPPKQASLLNVSTRLQAQTGDNVLIGGFIISGKEPKQIAVRGIGPSLPLQGALADPLISLYDGSGKLLASNDNWNADRPGVLFTGLAPADEHEGAMVVTLPPGGYTAILSGAEEGTGVALVEVYDLTPDTDSALGNISTRGKVETDDNVMIGGFIVGAETPTKVMIRGIGPSLAQFGIVGTLQDPVLELHGGDGDLILENDNWHSTQPTEIIGTGLAPTEDRESAIVATLQPGAYTAILRGQNSTTGVALVEVYNLDSTSAAAK